MKLSYEKVEMAACIVGRVRDCALESPCSFVCLVTWGEGVRWSPLEWPRGELRASCHLWNKSVALT